MQRVGFQQRQFAKRLRTAQTSLETAVWRELRAKRLDGWKFKRQAPIGPYVVDGRLEAPLFNLRGVLQALRSLLATRRTKGSLITSGSKSRGTVWRA